MRTNPVDQPIPRRALLLAGMSLLVPVSGAFWAPRAPDGADTLLWLTALIPAFVLSYYRGWQGSSIALAAGMVALATTNLAVVALDVRPPDWQVLFGVVTLYVGFTLGIGWLGDGLRRDWADAEQLAMTDSLTGLANRRFAERLLDHAFALAGRGVGLSVILFDVDHFKAFNDRHGHIAGDEVLQTLGRILRRVTRRSDLSARYGGEEFLCILHNCGGGGAMTFVERVREELARSEIPGETVTLSAGIATYRSVMETAGAMVAAADHALYAAKAAGRDCTRVWGPALADRDGTVGASRPGGSSAAGLGHLPAGDGRS